MLGALEALAANDPRVLLLTGDLGYGVVEGFAKRFPERFLNVGVAEQNLIAVATGLAEAGFLPFVYSIAPFAVLRPLEFIRNGPVLHRLPVRILGVGGGFEYGGAGATHHALEELGMLRSLPGLVVAAPADAAQACAALHATFGVPGPVYLRIGRDEQARVPGLCGRFRLGGAEQVAAGDDLAMVTTGSVAAEVAAARGRLARRGIRARVLVAACLRPAPVHDLRRSLAGVSTALVVEAHYREGGLGSLVSEVVAEHGLDCRVVRHGVGDARRSSVGSAAHLGRAHGLDPLSIAAAALAAVQR